MRRMTARALVLSAALVLFGRTGRAHAESPGWTCSGPFGGRVLTLAVSPGFSSDHRVLCGADPGGVFTSDDVGLTWKAGLGLPTQATVSSLVLSPEFMYDREAYLSVLGAGIYKSTDAGASWLLWSGWLTATAVARVAISPWYPSDQRLLAATEDGIYLSRDGGKGWAHVGPDTGSLSIAVSPRPLGSFVAYAGMATGVYTSTDSGDTWAPSGLAGMPIISLAVSPSFSQDRTVIAGTLTGAYVSLDAGSHWVMAWAPSLAVHHVLFSPSYAADHAVYLATDAGVFVSVDGQPPVPVASQVADTVHCLVGASVGNETALFGGTESAGVLYSPSAGGSWQARNTGLTSLPFDAIAVSPLYGADRTILAGGLRGMWLSKDDGLSWAQTTLLREHVRAIAYSPNYGADRTAYACTDGGFFASHDAGLSWVASNQGLGTLDTRDLAMDTAGNVWVSTGEGDVYYATAVGGSWTLRATGLPDAPVAATAWLSGQGNESLLVAGTWGSGLFTSANGGQSWAASSSTPASPRVRDLAAVLGYGGQLVAFASTDEGVLSSLDRGASWGATGLAELDVRAIAVHPTYASRPNIYAGSADEGVFYSSNGGLSWQSLNNGLDNLHIRALACWASEPGDTTLFAATAGGVWRYGTAPVAPVYWVQVPLVRR